IVTDQHNRSIFVKDAFHDAIIKGKNLAEFSKKKQGTKFSPVYKTKIRGGSSKSFYCRLSNMPLDKPFANGFRDIFKQRKEEADDFYAAILPKGMSNEMAQIQRQALAGVLWSKQYYHLDFEKGLTKSDGITVLSRAE